MEIAPILGIRALPAVKAPQGNFQAPEVVNLERPARPGDGEEQRQGRKAAGAEEDEEDDLMVGAEEDSGEGPEGAPRINFFA